MSKPVSVTFSKSTSTAARRRASCLPMVPVTNNTMAASNKPTTTAPPSARNERVGVLRTPLTESNQHNLPRGEASPHRRVCHRHFDHINGRRGALAAWQQRGVGRKRLWRASTDGRSAASCGCCWWRLRRRDQRQRRQRRRWCRFGRWWRRRLWRRLWRGRWRGRVGGRATDRLRTAPKIVVETKLRSFGSVPHIRTIVGKLNRHRRRRCKKVVVRVRGSRRVLAVGQLLTRARRANGRGGAVLTKTAVEQQWIHAAVLQIGFAAVQRTKRNKSFATSKQKKKKNYGKMPRCC